MKSLSVGEIKTKFSEILNRVKGGEKVGILYGKGKKPVAMIVPYENSHGKQRKIGLLDGKVTIEFGDDFAMTEDELFGTK